MNIAKRARVMVGAVALTGAAVATGGAFTATGIDMTAPDNQFIGGTVTQSVSGATLSGIDYAFHDAANTLVTQITLTFAGAEADGATVTLTPTGTGPGTFDCTAVDAGSSTCSFVPAATEDGYAGLTSISIEVGDNPA